MCEARPEYGSATTGMLEFWTMPQPLLVKCALPTSALRLWPLQVALVFDMTSQPCMFAFGAPLEVMPCAPLPASARMQNELAFALVATAAAESPVAPFLFAVAFPR